MNKSAIIMKFGGTSVATADLMKQVTQIVTNYSSESMPILVISACRGITDQLIECAQLALKQNSEYLSLYNNIINRHKKIWEELHGNDKKVDEILHDMFSNLAKELNKAPEYQGNSLAFIDLISGFGEQFSAYLLSTHMKKFFPCKYVNSYNFIVTNDQFSHAKVDFPQSKQKIITFFEEEELNKYHCYLVTGFVGLTKNGHPTTLGRDGSNCTAATLGAALDVKEIQIWSDVDGVLSVNPKFVPDAFALPQLSYQEALDFSNFGAKVIKSIITKEVIVREIPIVVKNTHRPQLPGTYINSHFITTPTITHAIGTLEDLSLLKISLYDAQKSPEIFQKIIITLQSINIKLVSSSTVSSLGRIYLAIPEADSLKAEEIVKQILEHELTQQEADIELQHKQVLVTFASRSLEDILVDINDAYRLLQQSGIHINAITQGGPRSPIIVFVGASHAFSAINVFYRSIFKKQRTIALALVGIGNIGQTLLNIIQNAQDLIQGQGIDLRVCSISNSRGTKFNENGIDLTELLASFKSGNIGNTGGKELATLLSSVPCEKMIVVDCTASDNFIQQYPALIENGCHIVAANKRANVLPYPHYENLLKLFKENHKHFFYSTNVGAGLPIISTIKDLIASGDKIISIEALLSGTLGYLFANFNENVKFSDLVAKAQSLGLTEPDVGEDLCGLDVARKILIIARQIGYHYNLEDISLEQLAMPGGQIDFSSLDKQMASRILAAKAKGKTLRYVAEIKNHTVSAGLKEIAPESPLAHCQHTDNIIAIYTKRYNERPLIIQGAGAGANVTAMGLLTDVLNLSRLSA